MVVHTCISLSLERLRQNYYKFKIRWSDIVRLISKTINFSGDIDPW